MKKQFKDILLIIFAAPVLGILLGGVYWLPAIYITKEREPWLTVLLAGGLGITVFGPGALALAPPHWLCIIWVVSIVLLLMARRTFGGLGHNLERFGAVHCMTLMLVVILLFILHRAARIRA